MKITHGTDRWQARARTILLASALVALAPSLQSQQPATSLEPPAPEVTIEASAEIERLTFEVRQAMSGRQWSDVIRLADALLLLDPGNSTARVAREQAERQIAQGVPEGIPTPIPTPIPEPTPDAQGSSEEPELVQSAPPPSPAITTGGGTPMELILILVGAVVAILVGVWFVFFARKKPAERRTPTPAVPVLPVSSRPISPYGKVKEDAPAKDENLIQYGAVGKLNKRTEGASVATAAAIASAHDPLGAMEDPPTDRPGIPPLAPKAVKTPVVEHETLKEESTHEDHDASHPAIILSEPLNTRPSSEPPRPVLSEPVTGSLSILKVDLDSVHIEPAPPKGVAAGPDDDSLPRIQLLDTPVGQSVPRAPDEPAVGSDIPGIAFDESIPLDLGAGAESPATNPIDLSSEGVLPGIRISEETTHLGGADDIGLNDLPALSGDLGEYEPTSPGIKLSDASLESLAVDLSEAASSQHIGVPTIKLME